MRTAFTPEQLGDPNIRAAEASLRTCVHCGFCTATCPTYLLLGDERDGPRGRIALIQHMLESDAPPAPETVRHIDRCISCLGCRTACPSSVDYADLVDTARAHIERTYRRTWPDRLFRSFLAFVLPRPAVFRATLGIGRMFAPVARLAPGRLGRMAARVPPAAASPRVDRGMPSPSKAAPRVALLPGCVQQAVAPGIDAAAARVLARAGVEPVALPAAGCCGALLFHMGRTRAAKRHMKRVLGAFARSDCEHATITATGCAAFLKDYPRHFRGEPEWEERARSFAARVRDFSELAAISPARKLPPLTIAYHAPCSLTHGQRLSGQGEALLRAAGFKTVAIAEGEICCGAGGAYSLLQPDIADALRARKRLHIRATGADCVASGNVGCLAHLAGDGAPPMIHLAELLDWAGGGPAPATLAQEAGAR